MSPTDPTLRSPRSGSLPGRLGTSIRTHPVAAFFLVTFAFSWGYDALVFALVGPSPGILVRALVRAWGPLVGAAVVTWASGGSVREWAGQVTRWRVRPRWYLVAFALPLLTTDAGSLVYALAGGSLSFLPVRPVLYLVNFLVVLLLAGSLEEFGWRGFAQPRLQERYSALVATVVVGAAWALWHAPLFLYDIPAYENFPRYLLFVVVQSVAFTWVYNGSGGSVLLVMLLHAAGDLPAFFGTSGSLPPLASFAASNLGLATYVALAALLLVRYGPAYLAPSRPDPAVPGSARDESS